MNNKKNYIIGVIPVILFLLIFISIDNNNFDTSTQIYQESEEFNLESSGFWYVTTTILIDDTLPANNWSTTASTNDWCSGYGNSTHPYVIEDIVMDLSGSGTCIEIKNSNVYFKIENCSLSNAQYGIILTENIKKRILSLWCGYLMEIISSQVILMFRIIMIL